MVILGTMIHGTMTTSSKKDYLSILGLSPDFDDKELKKAFRREARKWHPDLNKNDLNAEERFKLINEAYEYLSESNERINSSNENIRMITKLIISRQGFLIFKIILIHYLDMNIHQRVMKNMTMIHLRMNR